LYLLISTHLRYTSPLRAPTPHSGGSILITYAAMLHTLQLQNIPVPHEVHIALFNNVTNSATLRDKLLAGDQTFQYAFVDAKTVRAT
jgi:hypothetical protein